VSGDVPDRHAAGVEVKHPLVETGQAGLALLDQLGLEAALAVARGPDPDRAELGPDRLRGRPVTDVRGAAGGRLPGRVAQVAAQLGSEGGLDHPAGELGQEPAGTSDLLRLKALERALEHLRGQQTRKTINDLIRQLRAPSRIRFLRGHQRCPLPAPTPWSLAASPSGLHGSRPRPQTVVSVTPTSHRRSDRTLSIHLELGADWRRFERASTLPAWLGLTPSLNQSGESSTQGAITKTGSTLARRLLVESAWHYSRQPRLGATLANRQAGQPDHVLAIANRAQQRLYTVNRRMKARGKPHNVTVVACARQLACFLWAAATAN
jgi:Transposase IS116/IS110/IS902 family